MWGQVCMIPGAWSRLDEDGGGDQAEELILNGDKAGGLILSQYGVRGAWSQPEGGGDKDKAGGLIPNQYGGSRCVVLT